MNWKKLLGYLALPLGVGALSSLISGGMALYGELTMPPLSPPGWVFPLVWKVLYLLMGYSAYRVSEARDSETNKRRALHAYYWQLAANFLWSPVFFGLQWYLAAVLVLVVLIALLLRTVKLFSAIDSTAESLLLPYVLWCLYALYLNFGVYLLN